MIYGGISATVGNTPIVEFANLGRGLPARILGKLEMRNPAGSVKDRLGVALIDDAENNLGLQKGMTLIEATGGNTGIGLAFVAAARGYRLMLTMPKTMSAERIALLRFLGAHVELTPGILMNDAVTRARALAKEIPNSILLNQFENPANPEMHRRTTAVEILRDVPDVDVFVSAVGTGGTLTGVGEMLKERNPKTWVVAVEPATAAVLSGRDPEAHRIPGIGVGFVPKVLNRAIIDEVVAVSDDDAFLRSRELAREEGILAGISSGAALHAALTLGRRERWRGATILAILADSAERYITTDLFGAKL